MRIPPRPPDLGFTFNPRKEHLFGSFYTGMTQKDLWLATENACLVGFHERNFTKNKIIHLYNPFKDLPYMILISQRTQR